MSSPNVRPSVFEAVSVSPDRLEVDLLVVPVFGREDTLEDLPGLDAALGGEWRRTVATGAFSHKTYETMVARVAEGTWRAAHVCVVGAGPAVEADAERLRRVASVSGYLAVQRRAASVGWVVRGEAAADFMAAAVADGLTAPEFNAGAYRTGADRPGPVAGRVVITAPGADVTAVTSAVRRGHVVGESANLARALANEPGNVLTPREFARRVQAATSDVGLAVDVLDEPRLRDLGMGLLFGVAQGSAEPPRLVVIRHEPRDAPASPVLALVGKGVTFDSGGLSIKPAAGMDRMKGDMTGGASVAAAMRALALLGAPFRVLGLIPATENMPGGRATRPGDVLTSSSGKTVEVINTDAEGRLILADALWYARQLGATHLVDVATLTGACLIALGHFVSGLFGQPDDWVETVRAAARQAGDRVWPLPIYEEAREQLHSDIADIVNSGGRPGGAITAAAFLREFVGDRPWAHLDIAGTAWADTPSAYQPRGATGVSVRTLIQLGMTGGLSDRGRTD